MWKIPESVRARAGFYKLLAEYYYPPTQVFLQAQRGNANEYGTASIPELIPDQRVEMIELLKDYTALFVGPFEVLAPPYGSVYLENEKNQLYGDSTLDVKRRYEEDGLSVVLKEPPDHIAIELEYAHLLALREADLVEENKWIEAAVCRKRRIDFLHVHLAVWVPLFAQRIADKAETEFYRQLASITDSYIQQESLLPSSLKNESTLTGLDNYKVDARKENST